MAAAVAIIELLQELLKEFLIIFGLVSIVIYLIVAIANWRVFTKAGKAGWAAFIPIYNIVVLLDIIGKPVWWIFLYLVPIVNVVFIIWTLNLLGRSFGRGEGFTIGLLMLPFIFFPILGFSRSQYLGQAGKPDNISPFDPAMPYRPPLIPPPKRK